MQTAVAYIRVSSQRQVEEGSSLDVQMRQVEQFAVQAGYRLARVFREEGESAKTDQRPKLQEMLEFCRDANNGVQVVIVPKIDRLARNVHDYTNLKLHICRLGIRLESLGERIEDTPVGRLTETILASVAQFDNEIRAERSKGGMIEAVSQGRWVWKPPVGYRSVRHQGKGTIEPDPEVAPLIQEAFRHVAFNPSGAPAARKLLKNAGIARSESSFYRMLQNEVYVGRINAFGKVFKASSPFDPLIDEITFFRAQQALKPSLVPKRYQIESSDFPLRGSVLCRCGKRYTASWSRGKQGHRYAYYRCRHCNEQSFAQKVIDGFFKTYLGSYRGVESAWDRLEQKLLELDQQIADSERIHRSAALARIEEITSVRDAIAVKNAAGVIPDDVARRQIARLGKELVEAAALVPMTAEGVSTQDLITFAKRFFFDLQDAWHGFTLKTKKDLLRFMFPEGILFHLERGFETPQNSLAELFQQAISGADLHLVDPTDEFAKSLREWLSKLRNLAETSQLETNNSVVLRDP